jgi:hypothetical protein
MLWVVVLAMILLRDQSSAAAVALAGGEDK